MFKGTRWRNEKNKIKVVFKLQFQATQVPQLGKDTLMVSLVPVEVGRPTVRLEKTAIRDGACRWENPIYETVKFIQESKTGKVNEKIYQFIVSTGSSKAGVLGDVTINFADYFDSIKPSSVSLPLKSSNSGAILHITIHRMHGALDQRDVKENGDATINLEDKILRRELSDADTYENDSCNTTETGSLNKSEIQNGEPNGKVAAPKGSDAISAWSSESSSERDTPRELGKKNNDIHQDSTSLLSPRRQGSMPHRPTVNVVTSNGQEHRRSNTEWSVGSAPDGSVDGSTNSSEDNLKRDFVVLARQAEVSELELQTLRKQIVKESKRGQDLSREVLNLKEERDALKKECEQLMASRKRSADVKVPGKLQFETEDPRILLQEMRQELNYEKDLNTNLRLQLQKTQESNSELILAVRDLDEMLEQKNREISYLSNKSANNESAEEMHESISKQHETDDEEQHALDLLVKEHNDTKETHLLEQKIIDLYSEVELYRRDKDELEMQMEQLALDYEILKQENHDMLARLEQNFLQEQLKVQYEYSSFATISELESQVESLEKELKEQKECAYSFATVRELENQIESLEKELKEQKECSSSFAMINELERRVKGLEKEIKEKKEECSSSFAVRNELETQVRCLEKEMKEKKEECSSSFAARNELEAQVKLLEKEIMKKKEQSSTFLGTIKELQSRIEWLEKELEIQAQGFETDLEAVTHAKVEQEKRAIRAEEALRKTKWNNANTAERLQEEFRRLSLQMASTFDTNEKLAMKAVTEANELRLQKGNLEEMLENANEELRMVKDQYEENLKKLSNEVDLATKKAQQLLLELEDKSKKLEQQQKHEKEMHEVFSKESLILKAEIEKLRGETNDLSKQAQSKEQLRVEMERMEMLVTESDLSVQQGNVERNELEIVIASVRKEAEKSVEQLNGMRMLKDEKVRVAEVVQSELAALKAQYNDLKHSLSEDESEKETLRKQVSDLKVGLKKKEDKITAVEKKLKESSGRTTVFDGTKPNSKNNKSALPPRASKEVASLREKIKLLEGHIKLKEAALEKSNNSFLEKEKDLSCRIEELENRVTELNRNSTSSLEDQFPKVANDVEDLADSAGNGTAPIESCDLGHLDELLSEMTLLKERNKSMEGELKDMQERYSEISLKFAEVEGERQQLVMAVRNLKNPKKN